MAGLQRGGTRDDLDELSSDDGLSGPVVCQRQLVNHLTCNVNVGRWVNETCFIFERLSKFLSKAARTGVLAGVVHGSHPGRLF